MSAVTAKCVVTVIILYYFVNNSKTTKIFGKILTAKILEGRPAKNIVIASVGGDANKLQVAECTSLNQSRQNRYKMLANVAFRQLHSHSKFIPIIWRLRVSASLYEIFLLTI